MSKYDWAAIKAKIDIMDVIGRSVPLKKKGNLHVGCCPFHQEKTPSFTVYADNYHCFGCGSHGDALDFIMEMDGCTTGEAIEKLNAGELELTGQEKKILSQRQAQRDAERAEAIQAARKRWRDAKPADHDHPYLARKGVRPNMLRQEGKNLLVPVYDGEGDIQSVQTINPEGEKRFHPGAPMKGGRLNLGICIGRTIVAEGYATADSVHDAIPDQAQVGFSKSGVIDRVRELHANGQDVVIAADRNALADMLALGEELGVPVYAPPEPHDDFNDLAVAGGDVRAVFDAPPAKVEKAKKTKKSKDPEIEDDKPNSGALPFPVTGIDLTKPPGFVGTLAEWIENCNRRPRRTLSVATAIVAVSNCMGLHYRDVRDGVTPNLFAVCIAGSRTGKESLNQSIIAIHRCAGVSAATLGTIKSEQEIVRNLISHQPAFYVIDEIGFTLKKIRNAQKGNGSASYLEAVIGVLMSAYSKASGYMPIGGDIMRALQTEFKSELARLDKDDDGSEWIEKRREYLLDMLNSPEPGLKNPFLSVIGYTTGETFNEVVDFDMATNGFIGRSLLFNERDTAPRSKMVSGFKRPPMGMGLELAIKSIAGGERSPSGRIEYHGDPIDITTDDEADRMLEQALVWFEDQAIAHKSISGLEALYLGAYELMAKVSMILAVQDRVRNAEHVRWAFELIRRDVGEKARMVVINEREKDAPDVALKAKIANLASDGGETMGVIYNRIPKRKREEIDAIVDDMKAAGLIEVVSVSRKGMEKIRYIGDS